MFDLLPFALITAHRTIKTDIRSALPGAPVVPERLPGDTRPRAHRSRAAVAAGLASLADLVAPRGQAPAHRVASSR